VCSGNGTFAIRFADFVESIAGRRFVEFTTYALASRLVASRMEARLTKVIKVFARFSKPSARRRLRPNGKRWLNYPTAWQEDEALHVVVPLDDRPAQPRHLCHGGVNLPGVGAAIGRDLECVCSISVAVPAMEPGRRQGVFSMPSASIFLLR